MSGSVESVIWFIMFGGCLDCDVAEKAGGPIVVAVLNLGVSSTHDW